MPSPGNQSLMLWLCSEDRPALYHTLYYADYAMRTFHVEQYGVYSNHAMTLERPLCSYIELLVMTDTSDPQRGRPYTGCDLRSYICIEN